MVTAFALNRPVASARLLFITFALLLSACVGVPQRPPVDDPVAVWRTRQTQLARLNAWDLRGRLALRANEEGAHASLRWVRDRESNRMNLAGPFGGGYVRLTFDGNIAELRDADGEIYRGASMQQVLLRATGWTLPIDGLDYWVLGLPVPDVPAQTTLDEWGRLKLLEQRGWSISFLEYTQAGDYELPKRVFIKHKPRDRSDAEVEARLEIETWEVGSVTAAGLSQR